MKDKPIPTGAHATVASSSRGQGGKYEPCYRHHSAVSHINSAVGARCGGLYIARSASARLFRRDAVT